MEIYNYSKKQDIYSPKRESGKSNFLFDQDLKGYEYRYFTYDYINSLFFSKRYINNYNEKNEVFWSNYDVQFNDLKQNIKKLNFENQLNFLLIDFAPSLYNSKKSNTNKNLNTRNSFFMQKREEEKNSFTHTKKEGERSNNEDKENKILTEIDETNLESGNKYFSPQESEDFMDNNSYSKKNFALKKDENSLESNLGYIPDNSYSQDKNNLFVKKKENDTSSNSINNSNMNNVSIEVNLSDKINLLNIIDNVDNTDLNNNTFNMRISEKYRSSNKLEVKNFNLKNLSNIKNSLISSNHKNNNENHGSNIKSRFDSTVMTSNLSSKDIIPFHIRVRNCIIMVENYLLKYKNFTEKFSNEITFLSDIEDTEKDNFCNK